MAVIDFSIENYDFNPSQFIPLDNTAVFAEPYHAVIDIYHSFHSTFSGSVDVTMRLYVEFDIYGCTATAESQGYPHAYVNLGENNGQRGMGFKATGYDVRNINGFFQDQQTQRAITSDNYDYSASLAWASNIATRVVQCNIPLCVCYQGDLYPDNLFWTLNNASTLNLANYNPYTAQVTKEILTNAINANDIVLEQEGIEFNIINPYETGTWDEYGVHNTSPLAFRNVRGKLVNGGKIAFYPIGGEHAIVDDALKLGVTISGTFEGLQYSVNAINWTDTDEFPFEFFYRVRTNEIGTFTYGRSFSNTVIPIFASQEDADEYIAGTKEINEAENWGLISSTYEPRNDTGDSETATEFGEVYTRAMFSQMYLCDISSIQEISNALFDYDVTTLQGIWEKIKKGLEMYGSNPMEVVQGLRYYPIDLNTFFTNTQSQQYIYFGAYQLQLQNSSVKKIIYSNGYKDLGTVRIKRTFNDWRDFEPYTKLKVYLPYIGWYPLEASKYYDKDVTIRYFIDLRTGACTACLIANNVLIDYFDGIIGCDMPITLTDYAGYAQSQLNVIMRNAGLGIAGEAAVGNLGVKSMKAALQYNDNAQAVQDAALMSPGTSSLSAQTAGSYGTQAIATSAATTGALLGVVGAGTAMKTAFDLMKTGTAAHTKTRPASSAMINQYLPQYPMFRFEILEIDESPYLNELYGRPTNASGVIGDFSGYLEAEDIMLICPIATDNERQEIIDLVKSGIYI